MFSMRDIMSFIQWKILFVSFLFKFQCIHLDNNHKTRKVNINVFWNTKFSDINENSIYRIWTCTEWSKSFHTCFINTTFKIRSFSILGTKTSTYKSNIENIWILVLKTFYLILIHVHVFIVKTRRGFVTSNSSSFIMM